MTVLDVQQECRARLDEYVRELGRPASAPCQQRWSKSVMKKLATEARKLELELKQRKKK